MSRGLLPTAELRRAVWRREYGYLSPTRVKRLLRVQLGRTLEEMDALRLHSPMVRAHHPGLLVDLDEVRASGNTALQLERYREVVEAVVRGRALVATVRELVTAAEGIAMARGVVAWLQERARARLRSLPSVDAPARLLALAEERFETRRYRAATDLTRACARLAEPLRTLRTGEPGERARLEEQLASFAEICAATAPLVRDPSGEMTADGTLAALRALHAGGYVTLAARLADEVELALGARRQFLRELRRPGGGAPGDTIRALLPLLAGTDADVLWTSATRYLWTLRLEEALQAIDPPSASTLSPPDDDLDWFEEELRDI